MTVVRPRWRRRPHPLSLACLVVLLLAAWTGGAMFLTYLILKDS